MDFLIWIGKVIFAIILVSTILGFGAGIQGCYLVIKGICESIVFLWRKYVG